MTKGKPRYGNKTELFYNELHNPNAEFDKVYFYKQQNYEYKKKNMEIYL
jgi:hypothetical protein